MRLLLALVGGGLAVLAFAGSLGAPPPGRAQACAYLDYARLPSFTRSASVWLDRAGIPRVRYSPANPGAHNPVTIAQYGLQEFSYYAHGRGAGHLAAAKRAGEWLVRAQERPTGRWLYRFDWTVLGSRLELRAPWASAMAQGQAISLLARLFVETGDRRYLESATRALQPLTRPVHAGGLVARLAGWPFYEEYPTTPPSYVLNGFMFTVLGLRDLESIAPSRPLRSRFRQSLETLAVTLPHFDLGRRSLYHLAHRSGAAPRPYVAPLRYQRLHVRLLTALAGVSRRPRFARYAARWRRSLPRLSAAGIDARGLRGDLALCSPHRS